MLRVDESGKTLVIALIAMGVATLFIGGFLAYVSTSQRTTEAMQETLKSHYAADAGVEHAIWRLTHETGFEAAVTGGSASYTVVLNSETVVISVTRVTPTP